MAARSGAVLVADDDKINRIMLSKLLENEGYQPTTVVDGEEALAAVAKERFDAVLLDIMMPGVDGIEVLRSLKSDSRWWHIPVIMVSAVEETDSIARCIELGAEDYLLKPFDPVLLRARVNACLARKRFHDLEEEYHAIVKEQRAELESLNRQLSQRVWTEVREVERLGHLRRFLAPPVAEQLAAPDGEDRLAPHRAEVVVVSFVLSGTSALAETNDPAATVRILDGFHTTLADLAGTCGATVALATAESVTVLFNDPLPCPDGVTRARQLAAEARQNLAEALVEWSQRHDTELGIGVGIASGAATLGRVGPEERRDYVAVGAVVDRAQRLAREAGPAGGVLLDDETRAALESSAAALREP